MKEKDIKYVFESNPELAKIGNEKQYEKYLKTIFPDSKVQDIVFHGGLRGLENFENKEDNKNKDFFTGDYGTYFTKNRKRANAYIKSKKDKEFTKNSFVYPVLINIKNPLSKKIWSKWKFGSDKIGEKEYSIINKNLGDGIVDNSFFDYVSQFVILDSNQAHILGSKKDIQGFKEFVKNKDPENLLEKIVKPIFIFIFSLGILLSSKIITGNVVGNSLSSNLIGIILITLGVLGLSISRKFY